MQLTDSITTIKGIGPKTAEKFRSLGVENVGSLLSFYPRDYIRYNKVEPIVDAQEGYFLSVMGSLKSKISVRRFKGRSISTAVVRDESGEISCIWFNMPYLKSTILPGRTYVFRGRVKRKGKTFELVQPEVYQPEKYEILRQDLQPVYRLKDGLKNTGIQKAVRTLIEDEGLDITPFENYIPGKIKDRYHLEDRKEAIINIHFPKGEKDLEQARERLVFEEFFNFFYSIRSEKAGKNRPVNHLSFKNREKFNFYLSTLPFSLTEGQKSALEEILNDLTGPFAMNRLIQGDVGSGKTVIAVATMILAAENGYQSAMMAPTEVLAKQHYESIFAEFTKLGLEFKPVLLNGSMTAAQKREAKALISSGESDIVIGTHALIQESVEFRNLALVITDEQHRFGVNQRAKLQLKGLNPHVLVMSATPIPRTLALIMYKDLDISLMKGLPLERLPIKNCAVDTSYRNTAYRFILNEIREGHQAYIVCPLIEESENLDGEDVISYAERLRGIFPKDINIGIIHGEMSQEEKDHTMEQFKKNCIHILVSTTVIEVGINVPNATVMMIENAERFGLSTLHQLRGRVGRGKAQSYCIFVSGSKNENTRKRLKVLCNSNDGFKIAEEDLKLRGPGELFGTRQSGILSFSIGDIYTDAEILKKASEAADYAIENGILFNNKYKGSDLLTNEGTLPII